jgi:hypothetical protein
MNPELGESNEGDLVWLWNDIQRRKDNRAPGGSSYLYRRHV